MAEDYGPLFVRWMLDSGSEVASHGYVQGSDFKLHDPEGTRRRAPSLDPWGTYPQ